MSATFLAWLAAAVVVLHICQFIYVYLQAVVGKFVGGTPTEVSVGLGPSLVTIDRCGVRFLFRPFPLSGYTTFRQREGDDELSRVMEEDETPGPGEFWEDVSAPGRILTMLIGPLSTALLGAAFLALPVLVQRPQLIRDPEAASEFKWSAVPGLRQTDRLASMTGQLELANQTAIEFVRRACTLRSLKGWGGYVGMLVTTASTATTDYGHFFSCLGVVFVVMGLCNLLPVPMLNGSRIVITCAECAIGRPISARTLSGLAYVWLLATLAVALTLLIADIQWIKSVVS